MTFPAIVPFQYFWHSPTKSYGGRYFEGEEGVPVGAGVLWMWGGDACVAHEGREQATGGLGRGRRKRPLPPHPPPPPLRERRRFPSVMIKNLPVKGQALPLHFSHL